MKKSTSILVMMVALGAGLSACGGKEEPVMEEGQVMMEQAAESMEHSMGEGMEPMPGAMTEQAGDATMMEGGGEGSMEMAPDEVPEGVPAAEQ